MPVTVPAPLVGWNSQDVFLNAIQQDPALVHTYFTTMAKHAGDMEDEVNSLKALVVDLEAQNLSFSQKVITLEAVNETLKDLSSRAPTTAHLSPKHPDPDKFGGNKEELLQFTTQLKLKLNINSDHYSASKSDIAYAISRLEGNALSQVLPLVKSATEVNIDSIETFFKILEAAFGDPDKKGTAQRKIRSLRQTNRAFHEYLADFQRYIVDTDYNEEARLAALIEGLSQELKSMLMYIPTPRTMMEAIETLQSLENRRKMFGGTTNTSGHTRQRTFPLTAVNLANSTASSSAKSTFQTPVTTATRSPSTVYPASSVSNYTTNDPMDLSSSRPRGPLTAAERERRISLGLCLYCGGSGHVAKSCPNSRKTSRLAVNEATSRVEEVVSEADGSEKA